MSNRKKIGIMGGTFDPVHNAHLELAALAFDQYLLDTVLFVPARLPIQKVGNIKAAPEQRYDMLKLACEGHRGFEVSTVELERRGITYTIDTLHELREHYGAKDKFFLIMGEDAAADLGTWKSAPEIAREVTVLYAKRPGSKRALGLPFNFECYGVEMPSNDISSSKVRAALEAGEDVSEMVPGQVLAYINEHGLYVQS